MGDGTTWVGRGRKQWSTTYRRYMLMGRHEGGSVRAFSPCGFPRLTRAAEEGRLNCGMMMSGMAGVQSGGVSMYVW